MKEINTQNIGIIGNGSWGTALAKILTDNGHTISWYIRNQEAISYLEQHDHNPHYLSSVKFSKDKINADADLTKVLNHCTVIIFCVPAAYALSVLQNIYPEQLKDKIFVSAVKGMLPDTNELLNEYLFHNLAFPTTNYVAISGPCHAEEVAAEKLSYLTFSALDEQLAQTIAALFRNDYLRTTTNTDLYGVQLAAVLKNVYALGAGIAHSLDYGDNFLSVYITNCYREMYHFLKLNFENIHANTPIPDFHISAYLGDLLVTAYSMHSRNRRFGMMIGKGHSASSAGLELNMVAEGYYASKCIFNFAQKNMIPLPIASKIYEILWLDSNPNETFNEIENLLS